MRGYFFFGNLKKPSIFIKVKRKRYLKRIKIQMEMLFSREIFKTGPRNFRTDAAQSSKWRDRLSRHKINMSIVNRKMMILSLCLKPQVLPHLMTKKKCVHQIYGWSFISKGLDENFIHFRFINRFFFIQKQPHR